MLEKDYFKSQALFNLLIVCMLAVCLPCVVFASIGSFSEEQVKQLAAKYERSYLEADATLIGIKLIRKELSKRILDTLKTLESLEIKATDHNARMQALLHNDQGRFIAHDPNSPEYGLYLLLLEEPVVTLNEINEKQLQAFSLQEQIFLGQDGPEAGYLPNQETRDKITLLYHWAIKCEADFDGQIASLNQLVRWEPTEELDTAQALTLDQRVEVRKGRWERFRAIIRQMVEDDIRPEVKRLLYEVYKEVEYEKARLQAEILKEREDLDLAQQRQVHEITMQEDSFLLERKRKLFDEDLKTRQAELASKIKELEAARALEQALADLNINKIETDAARQQLIARAESKDVQLLLRPFIKKGYWQPNRYNKGLERSGISLDLIQKKYCLVHGIDGLKHLLALGTDPHNKERGPWTFPTRISRLTDEQFEQLKQARKYLIELGPTLVELGYLAQ